jgi:hypothetical protein
MRTIARELHCNAVSIIGTRHDRQRDAAEPALAEGLDVWLEPRLIDATWPDALAHVAVSAEISERLRGGSDRSIVLPLGCELSLFLEGILPGRSFMERMRALFITWIGMPLFGRRLNAYLRSAVAVARGRFDGRVAYAAGEWEGVDLGQLRRREDHGARNGRDSRALGAQGGLPTPGRRLRPAVSRQRSRSPRAGP